MFNVIITYDYGTPAIPQDYMVLLPGAGYPKTNYKIVGQAATQQEGIEMGQRILMEEMDALSWLLGDPMLAQLEADEKSDRKDIYRWFEAMEQQYQSRLADHRSQYAAKIQARREELIALHTQRTPDDETGEG